MTSAAAFRGTYSPGGIGPKTRKRYLARYNGRKGGLASGIKRRQLAHGRRDTRDGGLGVPKAYAPVPRLSDEKLELLFADQCRQEGRRYHQGGCDTFKAVYLLLRRWHDAKGQDFEITNENVSQALGALGRPHSRRTVQYTRQRLERSGVLSCAHVKRSGPRRVPGQMDTVRVRLRRAATKHCTPPLRGTTKRDFVPELSGGEPEKKRKTDELTASIPPTSSADEPAAIAAHVNGAGRGRGGLPAPPPNIAPCRLAAFTTDRLERAQQLALSLAQGSAIPELAEHRRLRRG